MWEEINDRESETDLKLPQCVEKVAKINVTRDVLDRAQSIWQAYCLVASVTVSSLILPDSLPFT